MMKAIFMKYMNEIGLTEEQMKKAELAYTEVFSAAMKEEAALANAARREQAENSQETIDISKLASEASIRK